MTATAEDRELRRTTRGTGAPAAPGDTQNGGVPASFNISRVNDATIMGSSATPATNASGGVPIKRSESDQGSAKDNDEMDVDSMIQPEPAAEDSGELPHQSGRDDLPQDESFNNQARASREQASGLGRNDSAQNQVINATDEAHAQKKRKVDDLVQEASTSSVQSTSPRIAAQSQEHRPGRPSEKQANVPQTTKTAVIGQSGRPGSLDDQGTRTPLQRPGSQSTQSSLQTNTQRPSQPRQTSSTQIRQSAPASAIDNVVIADVETAPPTRMSNAPPSSSATPTSAAVGSDKTKKAVKRPAPLVNVPTSGNGNGMSHPPPQKSARSIAAASGLAELDSSLPTGIANVSPVVSGFPMHTADKATLESFRFALQIKDQQRDLIEKRLAGKIPQEFDQPGTGPPPSAGPMPPMMYLHRNSVGSRRSEAVKQKVQGMRVSTGTEGYRQNGVQASRGNQQPQPGALPSSIRTTAHATSDDGYDEDDGMIHDLSDHHAAALREGPLTYSSQQPLPGSARYPPTESGPAYPRSTAGARPSNGEAAYEVDRRGTANGYAPAGASTATRPPPGAAYPPGAVYGQQASPYQRSAKPSEYAMAGRAASYGRPQTSQGGGATPQSARGEYPPGTMYPPRLPATYPTSAVVQGFRPRSPGRGPPGPQIVDVNKEHFMEPFHLLFDTFMDSMQLKRDLESKIRRANDLVEAQEAELRRISGLRVEFERSLDRLQRSQERFGHQSSLGPGGGAGSGVEYSPPPSAGSIPRAPTVPEPESAGERERNSSVTRNKQ
ncbi:hypothetical protein NliqN6_2811 [Naganishia liquefaciens]|uniref:Uncharacterized protein n=1 Tax=Naganishia liquefaciens TaxID=104408 RepID=A0A8H3YEF4_9TREE|nr:hypothetical protein NliqN6_2811 [Naganishia liquefaciens]